MMQIFFVNTHTHIHKNLWCGKDDDNDDDGMKWKKTKTY